MNSDKFYIYYIRQDGDGMFLTKFTPKKDGYLYYWAAHTELYAWNIPLFFPVLEIAETFLENLLLAPPIGLVVTGSVRPCIGMWLTMSGAKRNEHPDPYEWADWKPDL